MPKRNVLVHLIHPADDTTHLFGYVLNDPDDTKPNPHDGVLTMYVDDDDPDSHIENGWCSVPLSNIRLIEWSDTKRPGNAGS